MLSEADSRIYILYTRYTGGAPNKKKYLPWMYVAAMWAVSIHMVTAFLLAGLPARPFWNTALLGPRFLASAFTAGPAAWICSVGRGRIVVRKGRRHIQSHRRAFSRGGNAGLWGKGHPIDDRAALDLRRVLHPLAGCSAFSAGRAPRSCSRPLRGPG